MALTLRKALPLELPELGRTSVVSVQLSEDEGEGQLLINFRGDMAELPLVQLNSDIGRENAMHIFQRLKDLAEEGMAHLQNWKEPGQKLVIGDLKKL
jgi:hypothetical protein